MTGEEYDREIGAMHEHFVATMTARLPKMTVAQKERYFAILSAVTRKLEDRDKTMKEIAQEAIFELAPMLMAEMTGD